MASNHGRRNGSRQNNAKQNMAKAGTTATSRKSLDNIQAGSGGRGGHRRRKGGSPEG